ncbi:MAG: M55 family metallopeptidase, partial [Planctomycetes bacterium]|nr:M55 family metallopeptidase [Planctomycetota bacterium]
NDMRIFISADMEGATGIVHGDQLMPSGKTYVDGKKLLTGDINAAIEGALSEAPDAEFVICDGHGIMRNIFLEDLHERASLVIGPATFENKPLCQSQGIDESFDLAFFLGYHSRAGTPNGLLSHTWVGSTITNFRINGEIAGETAINGAVVGAFGVPVGLVVGASELGPEAEESLPGEFVFVATKQTLGFNAAICMTPKRTKKLISDGAAEAVRRFRAGRLQVKSPSIPVTMEVETHRREMADKTALVPDIERTGERSFATTADRADIAAARIWHAVVRAQDLQAEWLR